MCIEGSVHVTQAVSRPPYLEHLPDGGAKGVVDGAVLENRVLLDESSDGGVVGGEGEETRDEGRNARVCRRRQIRMRVRGWLTGDGRAELRVDNESSPLQPLVVVFRRVRRVELDVPTLDALRKGGSARTRGAKPRRVRTMRTNSRSSASIASCSSALRPSSGSLSRPSCFRRAFSFLSFVSSSSSSSSSISEPESDTSSSSSSSMAAAFRRSVVCRAVEERLRAGWAGWAATR